MLKNDKNNGYVYKCAAICAVTAFCSLIYFIVQGSGFFTVCDDFNAQQLPFTISLHNSTTEAFGGWTWNNDLGVSTIQAYSFYQMGSPFFYLSMLFPASAFPYVAGWIYMLKYVVAGVTAFLFLSRHVDNRNAAIAGALVYAFSGFQSVNLEFYHFHDVVALFPLMLLGLERMMDSRDDWQLFVFAVFINCITNYYFFVSEAIFLIIYFVIMYSDMKFGEFIVRGLRCFVLALWGMAMAAVLFLPSIMYVLGNERSSFNVSRYGLAESLGSILFVAKGILLGGEAMNDISCIHSTIWTSTGCYLPMICVSLTLAYFIKRRDRLSWLTALLLVMSFIPKANSVFVLFTDNYHRWWFMLDLVMALCACKVIDKTEEYNITASAVLTALAICLLYMGIFFGARVRSELEIIYKPQRLLLLTGVSLLGVILTWAFMRLHSHRITALIAGICVFSVATTAFTMTVYKRHDEQWYRVNIPIGTQLESIDEQYRYNITENSLALCGDGSAMQTFSSTRSSGSVEFDSLFDYTSTNLSMNKNDYPGLTQLLGAKYSVVSEAEEPVRTYCTGDEARYVIASPACPIGFAMDRYITVSQLKELPVEQRGIALLQTAVVSDGETLEYAKHAELSEIDVNADICALTELNCSRSVSDFSRDANGFKCTGKYAENTAVYFSVPYDKGWSAFIDGEKSDIVDSGGMMILEAPAGVHSIVFEYETPYFKEGLIISAAAVSAYAAVCVLCALRSRRKDR